MKPKKMQEFLACRKSERFSSIILITGLVAMLLVSMATVMADDNTSAFATANLSNVSEGTLISPNPISENASADQTAVADVNDNLNESVSAGSLFMERVKLWFTFNAEKKVEQELKIARLELVIANHASKNNNSDAMEKAIDAHDKLIAKMQEQMASIREKAAKLNKTDEKLTALDRAIEVHGLIVAKLQNILANANLTANQTAKIEARLEKSLNNTEHLKEVQSAKIEKINEKIQNISEKIDKVKEKIQNISEKIENNTQ